MNISIIIVGLVVGVVGLVILGMLAALIMVAVDAVSDSIENEIITVCNQLYIIQKVGKR